MEANKIVHYIYSYPNIRLLVEVMVSSMGGESARIVLERFIIKSLMKDHPEIFEPVYAAKALQLIRSEVKHCIKTREVMMSFDLENN